MKKLKIFDFFRRPKPAAQPPVWQVAEMSPAARAWAEGQLAAARSAGVHDLCKICGQDNGLVARYLSGFSGSVDKLDGLLGEFRLNWECCDCGAPGWVGVPETGTPEGRPGWPCPSCSLRGDTTPRDPASLGGAGCEMPGCDH